MRLREFVDTYDLHDRLVHRVHVYPEREEVMIESTLSMDFGVDKPEGKLIFTGVKRCEMDALTPANGVGEILSAHVLPSEDLERDTLELVLEATLYPERKEEIKIIVVEASNVEWVPNK